MPDSKAPACQQRDWAELYRKRQARATPAVLTCTHCGDQFERSETGKRRATAYCTRACVSEANRRMCPDCGYRKVAVVRSGGRTIGASRCATCATDREWGEAFAALLTEWLTPHIASETKTCPECGEQYETRRTNQRFCSKRCKTRAHGHATAQRRRILMAKQDGEPFVFRRQIWERDGWRCKLCGKKVKADAVVPHPRAPVIDHIVPVAQGGRHVPSNVQTAHFLCNSIKGDRGGGEQLLLIG